MHPRPTPTPRPPPRLAPLEPPPPPAPRPGGGGVGDYAARLASMKLSSTADPRAAKPGLHPSTLAGAGSGTAAVAAAEREANAMPGFNEAAWDDEELINSLTEASGEDKDDVLRRVAEGWADGPDDYDEPSSPQAAPTPWWEAGDAEDDGDEDNDDGDDGPPSWQADGMQGWPLGGRGGRSPRVGAASSPPPPSPTGVDLITGEPVVAGDTDARQVEEALVAAAAGPGVDARDAAPFAAAFAAAARALQARLVTAVRAELAEAKQAQKALYKRSTTASLVADGAVLTGLAADAAGGRYSESFVVLSVPPESTIATTGEDGAPLTPRSKGGGSLAAAPCTRKAAPPRGPPLPYHNFSSRDPVVLTRVARDGATPLAVGEGGSSNMVQATVADVSPGFITLALSPGDADEVDAAGPSARWRLDATVPDVTATRQLWALGLLGVPWSQVAVQVGRQEATAEADAAKAAREAAAAAAAAPDAAILSRPWSPGELRVRSILLGDPAAATTAATPLDWARLPEWRADIGAALAADSGLNPSQRSAVATALTSTLTLWQGPPGTGKTRTLVALLSTLATASRSDTARRARGGRTARAPADADAAAALRARSVPVLACGDTNAAADNLTLGLKEAGVRVVRLGSPSKVSEVVRSMTLDALVARLPAGADVADLRKRAAAASAAARKASAAGDRDAAKAACAAASAFRATAAARTDESVAIVLSSAEVVTCTTAGAGDARRLGVTAFRSVVVDEATQATEPSTLIPLLRGAEWAVLVGDPRQLPPTVTSPEAKGCGLDASLFERLQAGGLAPILLDTQYRMHPTVAAFPSSRFYGGRLLDGVAGSPPPAGFPWPAPDTPVALVEADDGVEQRGGGGGGGGGGSICNPREAALALRAAAALVSGGDVETVAILTPYAGQARLLRTSLRSAPDDLRGKITVSTVDGFQGREADAVVITTVRSNERSSLGFVTDARRMNVALTRGRHAAVVVGAPSTLAANADWRAWIDWVTERGGLLPGGALPPVDFEPAAPTATFGASGPRFGGGGGWSGGGGRREDPRDDLFGAPAFGGSDTNEWAASAATLFGGGTSDGGDAWVPTASADDEAWATPAAPAAAATDDAWATPAATDNAWTTPSPMADDDAWAVSADPGVASWAAAEGDAGWADDDEF